MNRPLLLLKMPIDSSIAYMENKISNAQFVRGAIGGEGLPLDGLPQIAFVGRSNVGKSSLINSLTGQKNLAISSSTPGRTLQLNFFLINENAYFVDLPGYGYSKVSLKHAEKMRKMIMWYLEYSDSRPKYVVLIIDASVGPKKHDLEMLELLDENGHNTLVVANKADKIKSSQEVKQKKIISEMLEGREIMYYSTKTGKGKKELLELLIG